MVIGRVNFNIDSSSIKAQNTAQGPDYKTWTDAQLLASAKSRDVAADDRIDCIKELGARAKKGKTELYAKIYDIAKAGNSSWAKKWDDDPKVLTECVKALANENNANKEKHLSYFRNQFGVFLADYPEAPRREASIMLAQISFGKHAPKDLDALKEKLNAIDKKLGFGYEYHPFYLIIPTGDESIRELSDGDFKTIKETLYLTGRIKDKGASRGDVQNALEILQFDYKIESGNSGNKIGHGTIESLLKEIGQK